MGRDRVASCFPIPSFQNAGDFLWFPASHAHFQKGTHQDPDHVVQKTVASDNKPQIRTGCGQFQAVNGTDRGFFHFFVEAKGAEVMLPHQEGCRLPHLVKLQGNWQAVAVFPQGAELFQTRYS